MTDEEVKHFQEELEALKKSYGILIDVFEKTSHFSVRQNVHKAIYDVQMSIRLLEEVVSKNSWRFSGKI